MCVNLSGAAVHAPSRPLVTVSSALPLPHWLRQPAEQLFGSRHLDLVFRAIDHVVKVTGSVDSVGIGSDLDGFIQPVEEVENLAQVPALVSAIEKRYGAEAAEKILWGNAVRVLKQGWR